MVNNIETPEIWPSQSTFMCIVMILRWAIKPSCCSVIYWLFYHRQLGSRQDEHVTAIKLITWTTTSFSCRVIQLTGFLFLVFADLELEELEAPQRYRPDSLAQICKTTKFSESEIKRMYRGFKAHCPNGMVKEDTFKIIYGQFFPQGGS